MLFKRNISMVVIATLLFTFISTAIATPALGKASRVAVITELTGSATVKSAGGSREYDAYIDMGLNQGDYITTDANSSVKVKIKDHEDEFTIGANTVLSITTLSDKGNGKKSKIKMFAGSVWSNVKKLSGGDEYEVETPTAVMAVRGTKVLTNVNSETGETYVAVAAGTVSATISTDNNSNNNNNNNKKTVLIAASQQISLDSRTEVKDLETKVEIIDTKKFVSGTSSEIIKTIVKDKKDIDRENADFVAEQKSKIDKGQNTDISRGDANSSLSTKDQSALDKVTKNLDNLIGNIVKSAIESNKVDKDQINKVIEEVNKILDKKLDIDKVIPLDNKAGVDEALKKAKDEELKKLEEAKKAADEVKKKEEAAAKLKLAEALKKLQEEADRIAKEKEVLALSKPTPTTTQEVKATAAPVPTAAPDNRPVSTPTPGLKSPVLTKTLFTTSDNFTLKIGINNISVASQVFGVEVHLVYNKSDFTITGQSVSLITSDFFNNTDSVTRFDQTPSEGSTNKEIVYAALLPKSVTSFTSDMNLVTLPLNFTPITNGNHDLIIYVNVVNKVLNRDGSANFTINNTLTPIHITLNYTPNPTATPTLLSSSGPS